MCISNFNVSLDCFPKGHSNLHSHYHPHQNWVFLLFDFCQPDSWKDAVLWMYFLNINEIKLLLWSFVFSLLWMPSPICYSLFLSVVSFLLLWGAFCILWMLTLCLWSVSQTFYASLDFLLTLWELLP